MQNLSELFPELDENQLLRFNKMVELYTIWNQSINLISRKDIDHLFEKHVLHSLSIARFVKFTKGTKILDIGTGGGFPGIPLAVMFPEVQFFLVDSIRKKIKVVEDIISELKLTNCSAQIIRAEKVQGKFDFVVTRAVAPLPVLYNWTKGKIIKTSRNSIANGIIALKGGDLTEELIPFEDWYTSKNLSDYFKQDFYETKKLIHLFKFNVNKKS